MVKIIGHRGACNLWPENSLDGFRRTRDLGVDGVEFDVHVSRDDELVVIHDPTLDRTTEGWGPVTWRSAAELADIRLREDSGQGIPMLDEVLDVFADTSLELHIEIKSDAEGRPYPGLEQRLVDVIAKRDLGTRTILCCSYPAPLEKIRELLPSQKVLVSVNQKSAEALGGLAAALNRFNATDGCLVAVEKGLLSAEMDLCLMKVGEAKFGVWAPNEAEDIAYWLAQPVRQITTGRPDIALEIRQAADHFERRPFR